MKKNIFGCILFISILAGCGDPSPSKEVSESKATVPQIDVASVVNIIRTRCSSCHSATPTDDVFKAAPGGMILENLEQMQVSAARIFARAVASETMPFMNKTQMTAQERSLVGQWIKAGAPAE